MESVKVRIDGDADYGFKFTAVIPTIPKKVALYISTKKSLWLMDYDRALGVVEDYGENCLSAMIGHTDYMIIYPVGSAASIDGCNLVMGECLIMKAANDGVQCMNQKELEEAFIEFVSRTTNVYAGQYELPAYQVD